MTEDNIEKIKRIREERLAICNSCDFFNKNTTACNKCGCIMSIKTNLPDAVCPVGKW
jgi:hypothetical protein